MEGMWPFGGAIVFSTAAASSLNHTAVEVVLSFHDGKDFGGGNGFNETAVVGLLCLGGFHLQLLDLGNRRRAGCFILLLALFLQFVDLLTDTAQLTGATSKSCPGVVCSSVLVIRWTSYRI